MESLSDPWTRTNKSLDQVGPANFSLREDIANPKYLPGKFLYLDNMHAPHYGDFLVDVLPLTWAFSAARALGIDDLKVLIAAPPADYTLPMLEAAGIPAAAVTRLAAPILVEELFVATKSYQLQGWTSPTAMATWAKIRDAMDRGGGFEKIYVSRARINHRPLLNEPAVEELFQDRGFTIIHPQDLPIQVQITLWANARHAAGAAGTNMFGLAFQRHLRGSFIINSPNFLHLQEALLQAGQTSETRIYLGRAAAADPHSPWDVDIADLEKHLDSWLPAPLRRAGPGRKKLPPRRDKATWLALYDEAFYLNRHPDIRAAVTSGKLAQGRDHYELFGFNERRQAFAFDAPWYAAAYPDVIAEIIAGNFLDCEHHYVAVGRLIGFLPHAPLP